MESPCTPPLLVAQTWGPSANIFKNEGPGGGKGEESCISIRKDTSVLCSVSSHCML